MLHLGHEGETFLRNISFEVYSKSFEYSSKILMRVSVCEKLNTLVFIDTICLSHVIDTLSGVKKASRGGIIFYHWIFRWCQWRDWKY